MTDTLSCSIKHKILKVIYNAMFVDPACHK